MRQFLKTLHRWLGFPLGLLFIVIFGTGFLTSIDELLKRADYSEYQYHETSVDEDALALTFITAEKQKIRQLVMPTQDTPYYQAVLRGEYFTYAINDLSQVSHTKKNKDGFFGTVLQLHRNFLLGKEGLFGVNGKYYTAWVGLIALLIGLLGFWLWWPSRKTFKVKDVVPRGRKRRNFYFSHMASGVVTLMVIFMLALTGASISYRAIAQQLFGVEKDKVTQPLAIPLENNWQAWLNASQAEMPDAELKKIRFPVPRKTPVDNIKNNVAPATTINSKIKPSVAGSKQNTASKNALSKSPQLLDFRFLTDGDWFGLANSKVLIDKNNSTLVSVSFFADLPLGEKIYSILKPLHTGRNLHIAYVFVLFIFSLIGTLMVLSGLVSFVIKRRRPVKWRSIYRAKGGKSVHN